MTVVFDKMKRAQLYGQIFIYVLTIMIVSFILVYGYNAIRNFKDRADQVVLLKFNNDLKNSIESVTSDFGSVIKKDIQVGDKVTKVCFVENFQNPSFPANVDPIIKDSILSNTGRNIFLVEDIPKRSFSIGKISVNPDVLCISPVANRISLKLEGMGDHVVISKWN